MNDVPDNDSIVDESEIYKIRKQKLTELRNQGFNFPNSFTPKHLAQMLLNQYQSLDKQTLSAQKIQVSLAGRMVLRRIMGKASFAHLQDSSGRMQIYIKQNDLPERYEDFKQWDLGDILAVEGELFLTNTEELTVHVNRLQLLTKSLRPLPDKFHGLNNQELRYRKRYVDLIANETTRNTFILRSQIIKSIRKFMDNAQFLEVETPMLHPIPGGAIARPFSTFHNTLNMPMFLRIAPELYLKRLIVGGFDKVYEINRNFRNEGISTRHNPEFTMIEFYQAYANYQDLMDFTEQLMRYLANEVLQSQQITYQEQVIDLTKPFARLSVTQAILVMHPEATKETLTTIEGCRSLLTQHHLSFDAQDSLSKLQMILFEETVEHRLMQPTFITEYPTEVSPLARASNDNPSITDRFEFFVAGREMANGFSELNDAEDQARRFQKQALAKDTGDLEAMHFDSDYIEALEYGMPPTAGEGIGIDRLVMLFTNAASIREVILFPQLKLEQ